MDKRILLGLLMMSAPAVGIVAETNTTPEQIIMRIDTSKVMDLDEVVVVAQPKETTRLRLQPISASVFTNRELKQLNIQDLRDVSLYVPSFIMPNYGARYTYAMYVRGIGSRMNNPSVGIYTDNVPLAAHSSLNRHFYQIDRVDVLRGAQGTLYGVNTEGGLVRIYSKNPKNYQGTDFRIGMGTGLYTATELSHYGKLSDKVAFSLAGFYEGQKGFFKNTFLDKEADKYKEAGGKMRWIWTPSSRLTLDLLADYQYTNQNGFAYGKYDINSGRVALPATNYLNGYKRNMLTSGLNISYQANNFLITSTTSYQYLRDHMIMDQDYLATDYLGLEQIQKQNSVTQEIAVRSRNMSKWQWTTGVFGSYQWLRTDAPVYFGTQMKQMLSNAILSVLPASHRNMFSVWEIPTMAVTENFHTPQYGLGVFHESNVSLTDRLTVTLGLRYDYQHVKVVYDAHALMTLHYIAQMGPRKIEQSSSVSSALNSDANHSYNQLLPKFGLTYRIGNTGSNLYATVTKGYRAGGYNIQMFSDILQTELSNNGRNLQRGDVEVEHDAAVYNKVNKTISYKPEQSWNYEFGSHLNLFGGKIHADIAFFYMQIRNQQLDVMANDYGFGRMMVNAGKSSSCGAELILRGHAFDNHLSWSAAYGYTRATFREYIDSVTVRTPAGKATQKLDYKDNYVPYVPQHTFNLAADYRIDVANDVLRSVIIGANVSGNGKSYWDAANTYSQKFYAVLGAHVDIDMHPVVVSFWGRNLTDTRYNTFAVSSGATGKKEYFAQRGNPLQVGVDVNIHF